MDVTGHILPVFALAPKLEMLQEVWNARTVYALGLQQVSAGETNQERLDAVDAEGRAAIRLLDRFKHRRAGERHPWTGEPLEKFVLPGVGSKTVEAGSLMNWLTHVVITRSELWARAVTELAATCETELATAEHAETVTQNTHRPPA